MDVMYLHLHTSIIIYFWYSKVEKKHQLSNHCPKDLLDKVQDTQWGTQTVEGVSEFFGFNLRGESVINFFWNRHSWEISMEI